MVYVKRIVILLLCCFVITGCFNKNNKDLNDSEKFKLEYEELNNKKIDNKKLRKVKINKENSITYSSIEEIVNMINSKSTFAVFFGFSKDQYSRNIVEELMRAEKDVNLETLYYVNIENVRDEFKVNDGKLVCTKECSSEYLELVKILDKYLSDYIIKYEGKEYNTNTKRLDSPCVISFIDGKVDYYTTGIDKSMTDPYGKITKEMKSYAYNKFKCALKCIKKVTGKNVCVKNSTC